MNTSVVFLCSTILIWGTLHRQSLDLNRRFFHKRSILQKAAKQHFLNCKPKLYCSLELAMIAGYKRSISKADLKIFKRYHLLHLLTPSALHINSLLTFTNAPYIRFLLCLLIFFFTFRDPSLLALWRTSLYILFKNSIPFLKTADLAMFVFCFNIILGGHKLSPISHMYSFTFWSFFFTRPDRKKLPLGLINLQLLISSFISSSSNFIDLIIGAVATAFFSMIYPFIFLFSSLKLTAVSHLLLKLFMNFLYFMSQFNFSFFQISNSSLIPWLTCCIVFRTQKKLIVLGFITFSLIQITKGPFSGPSYYSILKNKKLYPEKILKKINSFQ